MIRVKVWVLASIILIFFLMNVALYGGLAYVAFHFVHKFW